MPPEVRARLRHPEVRAAFRYARESADMNDLTNLTEFLKGVTERTPLRRPISFEDMHNYKEILTERAERAFARKGGGNLGAAYRTMAREVDAALADAVPEYAARRNTYRYMMEDERALKSGWRLFESSDLEEIRETVDRLRRLDPSEGHLREFRRGMAAAWANRLGRTGKGQNVALQTVNLSDLERAKRRIVFDDDQVADAFFARAAADRELLRIGDATNNSVTAFSLAQNAGADAVDLGASVIAGNPIMAAGRGLVGGMVPQAVNRATAQAMRPMLFAKRGELDDLLRRFNDPRLGRRRATLGTATAAGAGGGLLAGQDR